MERSVRNAEHTVYTARNSILVSTNFGVAFATLQTPILHPLLFESVAHDVVDLCFRAAIETK